MKANGREQNNNVLHAYLSRAAGLQMNDVVHLVVQHAHQLHSIWTDFQVGEGSLVRQDGSDLQTWRPQFG